MSRALAVIEKLRSLGLAAEEILEVVELMSARSSGAERTARYRERKKAEEETNVTCDVTCDASHCDVTQKVSPSFLPPFSPPTPPPISPNQPTPSKIYRHRPAGGEFDIFWKAYPRKVAKESARKAFDKALRQTDLASILAGIETYRRDKPQYADWAHPASWLNAGRWGDDYSAPPPAEAARPGGVPEFKTDDEFQAWWEERHRKAIAGAK